MTDENTKTVRSVADCVPTDFFDRAYEHFAKAVRKHPRFADALFAEDPLFAKDPLFEEDAAENAKGALTQARGEIDYLAAHSWLDCATIAQCELAEAQLANAQGDAAATVDELYDAVAVLMRMIAVVEGKQRLGGEA